MTSDLRDAEDGLPPLLVTHDLDEARHSITDVWVPHDLATRDGRVLDVRLRHLDSERLTVGHLVHGADAELLAPPMREVVGMSRPPTCAPSALDRVHAELLTEPVAR